MRQCNEAESHSVEVFLSNYGLKDDWENLCKQVLSGCAKTKIPTVLREKPSVNNRKCPPRRRRECQGAQDAHLPFELSRQYLNKKA